MYDKLKAFGVKAIDIIGGEPTMHPEITLIVSEAVQRGFFVNVSSNGREIDILEEISAVDEKITVGISINDQETLERCASLIRKHKFIVKSIFSPKMDEGFVKEILALTPKKFYLIYRDAVDWQDMQATIPFHQFIDIVRQRYSAKDIGTVFCSGFLPDIASSSDHDHVRCPAGTTKLGVMPDGSIYPCNLFFGRREYLLGNILVDQFASIWDHMSLSFFRSFAENRCSQKLCTLHGQCHGGCPAQSLLVLNDPAAPDPRCGRE